MKRSKGFFVLSLFVGLMLVFTSFAPVFADNEPKTTVCVDGSTEEVTQGWMDAHPGEFTLGACPEVNPTDVPPTDTTMSISAKALSDHECNSTEWHFVINQIDLESNAPSSIHVIWANGNSADVGRSKFTGGVAHYSTTDNLDSSVTSATATIYSSWLGEFNLSHGPCEVTPPTENTAKLSIVNDCTGGHISVTASEGASYDAPGWIWKNPYVLEEIPAGSVIVTWTTGTPLTMTLPYDSIKEPANCLVTLPHTLKVVIKNDCDGYSWEVTVDKGTFEANMPLSGKWVDKNKQETSPNPSITVTWDDGFSATYPLGVIVEPSQCVITNDHNFKVTPTVDCKGYSWDVSVEKGKFVSDDPLSGVWTKKYEQETSPNPLVKLIWDDGFSLFLKLDTITEPANCVPDKPTPEPTPVPVPPATGAGDSLPWTLPIGMLVVGLSVVGLLWPTKQ